MVWSGGLLGGLPLAKLLLICLTWHILQGYNIELKNEIQPESQSDTSCLANKPCNLFGYSVALSGNSQDIRYRCVYVGAPGQDKGNGSVFKCSPTCTTIEIQDPDASK